MLAIILATTIAFMLLTWTFGVILDVSFNDLLVLVEVIYLDEVEAEEKRNLASVEVPRRSLKPQVVAPEPFLIDSWKALLGDLEAEGVELTGLGFVSGREVAFVDSIELHAVEIDIEEDLDTIVEWSEKPTTVLVEGEEITDEEILALLAPPIEEMEFSLGLNPDEFIVPTPLPISTVDEWLEEEDLLMFVLAATEHHLPL